MWKTLNLSAKFSVLLALVWLAASLINSMLTFYFMNQLFFDAANSVGRATGAVPLRYTIILFGLGMLFLLIFLLIFQLVFKHAILRPVQAVTQICERMSQGSPEADPSDTINRQRLAYHAQQSPNEIGDLAIAFRHLLQACYDEDPFAMTAAYRPKPTHAVADNREDLAPVFMTQQISYAQRVLEQARQLRRETARYQEPNIEYQLSRFQLFQDFTDQQRQVLIELGQQLQVSPGTVILSEGEHETVLYILLFGSAQVTVEQYRFQLNTINPGDFFGENSILTSVRSAVTVTALEETLLFTIGHQNLQKVLLQFPALKPRLTYRQDRRLEQIGTVDCLHNFTGHEVQELLEIGYSISVDREQNLYAPGSLNAAYLVLSGSLLVSDWTLEQGAAALVVGDFFGPSTVPSLIHLPERVKIQGDEPTQLLMFPPPKLNYFLQQYPHLEQQISLSLNSRQEQWSTLVS